MGGSKGDRKSYQATSAAKAAEALAAKGGAGGFGGFSGTRPVAGFGFGAPAAATSSPAVATSAAAADPLELSAQLDGELAQCLRHLSKRDTTTKLKALQNLDELLTQKTPAEVAVVLQPWAYHFKRLLLDPAKSVRIKAAAVMATVTVTVGKALAPQLKTLLGPWYLASFDPYPDAAAAAKKSLADVFPGRKQLDALLFCRSEILAHIATCLTSTPASLGDPKKDTPEELEERHERVLTASLCAAAALLTTMHQAASQQQQQQQQQQGSSQGSLGSSADTDSAAGTEAAAAAAAGGPGASSSAAASLQEVQDRVSEMLSAPGFFKQKLGSKSPVVQRAAYGFIQAVCSCAPQLLQPVLATAAPVVLGALQDKEPSNHTAMWEMLLVFVSSQKPDCWSSVNVQKAVVPRLLSLLRHGCYGSAVTSLPALLPFLAQLPRAAFALQPLLLLDQVLESIWIGQQQLGAAARGDRAVVAAVTAAYQECLAWGLRNAAALSAGDGCGSSGSNAAAVGGGSGSTAEQYSRQLLAGHFSSLLQLSVGSTNANAQLASDIVRDVLLQQCTAAPAAAAAGTASGSSSSSSTAELPPHLQVFIQPVGSNLQSTLSSCCSQQEGSAAAADAASGTPAVDTVCLRAQQLLDALADGSTPECQAAAGQLAGFCCAALLPVVQAGQQLQAPATGLLSRLIREHPGAARLPTSVAAAAAVEATSVAASPAAAAPAGTGVSSIAALVRLGISSCGSSSISSSSSSGLTAADAELLLSCVAGSSSTSAAWGLLLDEVTSEGHSVAAWRFFDTLLCHACSSNQLTAATAAAAGAAEAGMSAGESGSWSHPILDGYITQLVQQQLQQQQEVPGAGTAVPEGEGNGNDRASSSDGTAKGLTQAQAAAAALLGCCLGANKQQAVLLGEQATAECMQAMEASLSAVLQQQQQQEVRQPDAAAAPFIAALSMVLDSSTHVAASVTGSSRAALRHTTNAHSLWQQQPEALSHVLLLLWQLAWSVDRHDIDDIMCDANLGDSESEAGSSGSDGPSGSGSDGPSGSGSDGSLSDSSSDADFDLAAAAQHDTAAAAATDAASSSSSSSSRALAALCAAAAALWNPEVVSMALTELPASAASSLMQEVQQLLLQSLQKASAAAAAAGATSVSAAVHAGTQVACRAGVVLEGLSGRPEQQQELLLQLLAAVECWQHWATLSSSCKASACDNSSSSVEGGHTGLSSPVYCLMLQFASVLVLQAGCDVVLPLHHGHLLPRSSQHSDASGASSSSSSPSDADTSRLWLRLELLCANIALQQQWVSPGIACGGALGSDGLAKCVAAAAAAAERQLVRAAGKGSSGAASVVARSQLAAALAQLLASAGACCAANETTTAASQGSDEAGRALEVYSGTLQRLLGQVVAAVSTSVAARAHLQPVLSQFMRQHLKAAVLSCADRAAAAAAASAAAVEVHGPSAAATVLLAPVLAQCAHAFRFGADSDAALSASGFADLAVQLMHTATAVPSAAAGADAARLQAGGVPLPLLQLVVACFPVQGLQQQQKAQAKQQQQQLHAAASTAAERKGLAALLRHVCPANAPAAAGSTDAAATAAATAAAAAAAVQLQCQLQLCCVTYCWAEMQAAEWHIVLRDAQQRLTNARREVERAAGSLAGAVCTAAQQLLGSRGSGGADALSPAMAIQLLRRLEQKGLLQQQPAVAEALFAAATAAVQQLSQLSVLQLGLQVLVSVLQLQDKVQAAGRAPQLNLALPAAWREVLSLLLSLGAAVALVSSCGTACSDVLLQYCQDSGSTWVLLQQCLLGCSEVDGEAVGKVLAAADAKVDMLGVDAVGCCLALLQQGGFHHHHQQQQQQVQQLGPQQQQQGCEPLQELAWQLLLHPASLAGITHAATASSDGDEVGGVPEYGVYDDAAAYLVKVGLRPSMAAGLAARRPWQMHMLLWALLLGHAGTLPARSAGQRRLCQALREVPELVPEVLNRTAGLMGLGGSSKRHIAAAGAVNEGEEMPAATAAMSAAAQTALSASLQAEGTAGSTATSVLSGGAGAASSVWNVAVVLRSIGLPHSHTSWRLLAAAVYRAVLCTLPASARLWFSDLRDRSRSTAVENYTSRYESPALLAAEFAAIKRDAAGSSGEVGGSCSFRVVANPANREVTAVLEIEDGATLELVVKLPAASPLKAPEVACKNKVGIKDGRLRKWLLSIAVFLRNQNQGVLDGIGMWKANLEQEFAGVEACLICYSVISAANGQLPRISCKQCSVKFHPACLYKWFRSSGKSTCPHCSALF